MDGARLRDLHELAIAAHGGERGVLDRAGLDAAFEQARMKAAITSEVPDDPLHVAVHLLFVLVRNHYFLDGNKRIGWLAMEAHLRGAGLRVHMSTDAAEALVMRIADGTAAAIAFTEAVRLVAAHLAAHP